MVLPVLTESFSCHLQERLEALSTLGAGSVQVTKETPVMDGAKITSNEWRVTFLAANRNVDLLAGTGYSCTDAAPPALGSASTV